MITYRSFWLARCLLALLACLSGVAAQAHETGFVTIELNLKQSSKPVLSVEIDLLDLELVVGVDSNRDGTLLWHEYIEQRGAIEEYISLSLLLNTETENCQLLPMRESGGVREGTSVSIVTIFEMSCGQSFESINIDHRLLTEIDSLSALLLKINNQGGQVTRLLDPGITRVEIADSGLMAGNASFVQLGAYHIFIGYDHLAFLLLLLLPAARRGNFKQRLLSVTGIVTSFTLAHSITLALAATGLLRLPSQMVEVAIALSVILAGLINLYRPEHRMSWIIAYCFGLVHGFGFATVLADLAIVDNLQLLNLAAFNIGVELGQIAMVALAMPVLALLGSRTFYSHYVVRLVSLITIGFGCVWVLQRLG